MLPSSRSQGIRQEKLATRSFSRPATDTRWKLCHPGSQPGSFRNIFVSSVFFVRKRHLCLSGVILPACHLLVRWHPTLTLSTLSSLFLSSSLFSPSCCPCAQREKRSGARGGEKEERSEVASKPSFLSDFCVFSNACINTTYPLKTLLWCLGLTL